MRRALTLIELILSMVIIGIVFTVIPRLIMSMNQAAQSTIQEEALYNALAQIGGIINLPWDNNNTQNMQILSVTNGNANYLCDTASGYRVGGFVGGRNCIQSPGFSHSASTLIGKEADGESNDIDDYHDTNISADKNCSGVIKGLYRIGTTVTYTTDPASTGNADLALADLPANQSSNTKKILVRIGHGTHSHQSGCITSLEYHAFNIGHIQINSRNW